MPTSLRRPGGALGFALRALRPSRTGAFASVAMGTILERTFGELFDMAAERRGTLEHLDLRAQWVAGTDERLGNLEELRRRRGEQLLHERDARFTALLRSLVRAAIDEVDVERLRLLQNAVVNLHAAPAPLPEEAAFYCETLLGLRPQQLRALGTLARGGADEAGLARAAGLPPLAGPKLAADLCAAALAERTGVGLAPTAFGDSLWRFLDRTEC